MITWRDLQNFKAEPYQGAADGWGEVSNRARAAKDRVEQEMLAKLRDTQTGTTAKEALAALNQLSRNFQYVHAECGLIRAALNSFASGIAAPQRKLKHALEEAHQLGFTVKPDGSVQYPASVSLGLEQGTATPTPDSPALLLPNNTQETAHAGPPALLLPNNTQGTANSGPPALFLPDKTPGTANPNKVKAEDIASRIASAVRDAAEVDARYRSVLGKLKTSRSLKVDDATWADAAQDLKFVRKAAGEFIKEGDIPKGKSPVDNKKWWESLTQEQQDEYAALYPARIGALDGLPTTTRDDANRVVLAETHGTAQLQLKDWLNKEPDRYLPYISQFTGREIEGARVENPEWRKWNENKEELEGRLDGMSKIQSRCNDSAINGSPPAYLLGFDNQNLGHAIVSIGNPDTADNVATYVPGTGAKLSSIKADLDRADMLYDTAKTADSHRKTASVLWLGYDAPQDVFTDARHAKYADAAGVPLRDFLTGIDTAHGGNVNSTLLGHSYGTLVAGKTMRTHPDLPVDNAIFVGSPGVGVDHAKDLNIPADHVWSATAKNDPINLAPPLVGELPILDNTKLFDDHSILYGCDPTTEDFGGKTFAVADGDPPKWNGDMPAHSQYWEGKSLRHMTSVVTRGHP
ncbi:alpha/beta hydrolase [Streptomyces sp. NRRL S-1813]|uniref:alpha/beta hydrolase n=1 Tax=Streptomyces sp. NRRL S-1813 TaxID=1463888 RepID=UPI0004C7ECC3|nr:alpha/beta hydrolase [Streptomyces sp. NRRL S-1813]